MKVDTVEIRGWKGLTELSADLHGSSVFAVGGNAAGKTSFLSAVWCALTGKEIPPEPIQKGKRKAEIEVVLDGGLAVQLVFEKKAKGKLKTTLTLFNTETGEEIKQPRTHLNEIIGTLNFNPFDFMAMAPKAQMDYFCKVFNVDVSAQDRDYREAQEPIQYGKKRIVELNSQLEPYDPKHLSLAGELDDTELREKYKEAVRKKGELEAFKGKLEDAVKRHDALQEQIRTLLDQKAELARKIEAGENWLEAQEVPDVSGMEAELDIMAKSGTEIAQAKKMKGIEDEILQIENEQESYEDQKHEARAKKAAAIKKYLEPVPNMDYTEDGFILDGLPFDLHQTNTAAQIVAGIQIGSQLLGDVKIMRFDGSLMDQTNLDAVNQYAESKGIQLFIELVDRKNDDLRLELVENTDEHN